MRREKMDVESVKALRGRRIRTHVTEFIPPSSSPRAADRVKNELWSCTVTIHESASNGGASARFSAIVGFEEAALRAEAHRQGIDFDVLPVGTVAHLKLAVVGDAIDEVLRARFNSARLEKTNVRAIHAALPRSSPITARNGASVWLES